MPVCSVEIKCKNHLFHEEGLNLKLFLSLATTLWDQLLDEYSDEVNKFYQLQADSILDFSEGNPFSEVDRY